MHANVPGSSALVGANGGVMSKYSVGVYSTAPAPWTPDRSAELQAVVDGWPAPEQAQHADGWATIESYTVTQGRDGSRAGVVIGRLKAGGQRFVASGDKRDAPACSTCSPRRSRSAPRCTRARSGSETG